MDKETFFISYEEIVSKGEDIIIENPGKYKRMDVKIKTRSSNEILIATVKPAGRVYMDYEYKFTEMTHGIITRYADFLTAICYSEIEEITAELQKV